MLINQFDTDIILINRSGEIIYDDMGNYRTFRLGTDSVKGRNIRDLFLNLDEEYPLLVAVSQGKATENFTCNLVTERGISLKKVGSAYPLTDGDEVVGAVEFSHLYYDKDHIREIEQHADHIWYRKNHTKYVLDDIVTGDATMEEIKSQIVQIAITNSNVLIYGETGTGKELIAQSIHNCSRRYNKNFLSQNCGAIPPSLLEGLLFGTTKGSFTGAKDQPGLFELANGGTIFLDEINSLEPSLQVKLLKVIEDKKVRRIGSDKEIQLDFRIIAATNEDPHLLLRQGRIKPDLFYRLAVVYMKLPNLIERGDDISLLTHNFITYFNKKTGSSIQLPGKEIMDIFKQYSWPGNIRELRNVIEGMFAFAENDRITVDDIPTYILDTVKKGGYGSSPSTPSDPSLSSPIPLTEEMEQMERQIILSVYEQANHSLKSTANRLGISKQLLRYKLNRYEI